MGCSGSKGAAETPNPAAEPEPVPAQPTSDDWPATPSRQDSSSSSVIDGAKTPTEQKIKPAGSMLIAISEEEKAMNGAPEGELFVVTVLPREELALDSTGSPAEELEKVVIPALTASSGDTPWNVEFDAITALRRILVHHSAVVTSTVIETLIPGMEKSARSLRSVLAKNAIFCINDLFLKSSLELNLSQKSVDALSFALLDSCASNAPKAIRAAALSALDQAALTGPHLKLAPALASRSSHKNKDVQEKAMVYTERCLAKLAEGSDSTWAKELDFGRLLPALNFGLNCKAPAGKKAAKQSCALVANSLSMAEWEKQVETNALGLTPPQVEELKNAAKEPVKKAPKASEKAAERKSQLKELKKMKSGASSIAT
mmetsp:Transcript_34612/g.78240  ORF Transcript_34612/g.78240 Transcript_34612/m.78240 type:complete len:373 (+) Transcript_34612:89-1207(+)|eukprot:CAMPEP_0172587170 /NCGR_PEP_ID=MMETSP1068-20121228/6265_1 /TAXON_ID=35684 /ORGANISM="Pseudopedinella elastica, Strain CCMP716" /LENGTH=372 /DNA_ID=CAMNT_0013382103 /DNA_START=43 /DNA_END=1164 /DNA_ORIENTATION=-